MNFETFLFGLSRVDSKKNDAILNDECTLYKRKESDCVAIGSLTLLDSTSDSLELSNELNAQLARDSLIPPRNGDGQAPGTISEERTVIELLSQEISRKLG